MDEPPVLLNIEASLATITLNRPEVLNAENLAWVDTLNTVVDEVSARPELRVVLVRGAGRAFCSGMDLDMLSQEGMPAGFYEGQERAFHSLESMDKIVIAALHGYCLGGGLQLAISCDIRVCSADCRLGVPALREGFFPGMAVYRLPRLIGLGPARRLILSGEVVGPEEAMRLGLIDHLVPAAAFEKETDELVQTYLAAPLTASIASKRLLARAFDAAFQTVYEESLPLLAQCQVSPEVARAREAWRTKAPRD
ncbi:MAG: enoyl-CoA hydratase/isomerase family protein [Chloroflexi bacterium]|nr:enoyl-CoA hydratase/isomerase family protein [Chloroflexota bacterium]